MTTPITSRPINRSPGLVHRLDEEWNGLLHRPSALRIARGWALPGGEIQSLDDVLVRAGYIHRGRRGLAGYDDACDEYLLRLVTVARHDHLAGRIVLQRILPALCALARRRSAHGHADPIGDLVSCAWPIIRRYPSERRPRRVASNLVRDIGFETFVRPTRRKAATAEIATDFATVSLATPGHDTEPLDELVALLRAAHDEGAITERDVHLLCDLVTHGSTEPIAQQLAVTTRTIRNHRAAAVERLRRYVGLAA
jgi:hypothetical protein